MSKTDYDSTRKRMRPPLRYGSRTVLMTIYRLDDGRYSRPVILELKGRMAISAIPDVSIDWDRLPAMPA